MKTGTRVTVLLGVCRQSDCRTIRNRVSQSYSSIDLISSRSIDIEFESLVAFGLKAHAHGPPHRYYRSSLFFSSFICFTSATTTTSSATCYKPPSACISHNSPSHGCNGLDALSPPFSSLMGSIVINPSHFKFKRRCTNPFTTRDEADEERTHSPDPLSPATQGTRRYYASNKRFRQKALQNVRRPYLLSCCVMGPTRRLLRRQGHERIYKIHPPTHV